MTNSLQAQPDIEAIANEWVQFLSAYGDALQSAPHLYLLTLSWLPRDSRLWDIVHSSFSTELPMISSGPETWNCERSPRGYAWNFERHPLVCELGGIVEDIEAITLPPDGSGVLQGSHANMFEGCAAEETAPGNQLSDEESAMISCFCYTR